MDEGSLYCDNTRSVSHMNGPRHGPGFASNVEKLLVWRSATLLACLQDSCIGRPRSLLCLLLYDVNGVQVACSARFAAQHGDDRG